MNEFSLDFSFLFLQILKVSAATPLPPSPPKSNPESDKQKKTQIWRLLQPHTEECSERPAKQRRRDHNGQADPSLVSPAWLLESSWARK